MMKPNQKIVDIAANSLLSACVNLETTVGRLMRIKNPPQHVCDFIYSINQILESAGMELKEMRNFAEPENRTETDIEKEVERRR